MSEIPALSGSEHATQFMKEALGAATAIPDVINFRLASASTIRTQWSPLREFTEWLVVTFELTQSEVPACWPLHPVLFQELHALMTSHAAFHQPTDEGAGPVVWLEHLDRARERLRARTQARGCSPGKHLEESRPRSGTSLMSLTDDEWTALAGKTNNVFDTPEEE